MRDATGRGYGSTPGATSSEQRVIMRLAEAERRITDPWAIDAVGVGLDLIRQLIAERGQRRDLDDAMEASRIDSSDWCPPAPEFEADPPSPDA